MSKYLTIGGVRTIDRFHRIGAGETVTGQISETIDESGIYNIVIEFDDETVKGLIDVQ